MAPGYDGICSLQISNAAYLSSWTEQWVSLPMGAEQCILFDALLEKKKQQSKVTSVEKNTSQNDGDGQYKRKWNVNW